MKIQAARIAALEKRAAVVLSPEPRFLAVDRLEDGTFREPSTGRIVSAAEVDEVDRSGGLVVILAIPPPDTPVEGVGADGTTTN